MSFRGVMLLVTMTAMGLWGLLHFTGWADDGRDVTKGIENSLAENEIADPTVGNFLSAFGIALGGSGKMASIGEEANVRLITDPAETRRAEFYGWKVSHPGLIGPGDDLHLVQSALSGLPMNQPIETPASVEPRAAEANCTPPPRTDGTALAKVQVFAGLQPTGYHVVTDRELVRGAMEYVSRLQRAKTPESETPPGQTKPTPVVNVVLTDESAPLYLVLQAASVPVVWNLHATPGVEVAQIVLVGNPGVAVNPLTPGTPVTILGLGDDCAPQPWRAAQPWWDMYHRPGGTSGNYEEESIARHAAYELWFSAAFGEASEPGTVGGWEVNHVLVGPLPDTAETRAAYRPLDGARLVAYEGPLLYTSSGPERVADIRARQHAMAVAAAGGDLAIINPSPVERAQ